MKVALAHDYLTQRGGAERVALQLAIGFERAPLYTSLFDPSGTFPEFASIDVRSSRLSSFSLLRKNPYYASPLLSQIWSSTYADDCDVVVASSSGWAHGIKVPKDAKKVVYCHNPPRWLYQSAEFGASKLGNLFISLQGNRLRQWDQKSAHSADLYIANSTVVARRIEQTYGREALTVHPPYSIDPSGPRESLGIEPGYWLTVSRGRSYKNTSAVIDAVESMSSSHRLVVVGPRPQGVYSARISFTGTVSDSALRWLYEHARGLVSVSFEDFGLTPIEANSFGTPVAVLRGGGFLDSTDEGVSGCFIDAPDPGSIQRVLTGFPEFDPRRIKEHASRFSPEAFRSSIRNICADVVSR